AGACPVPIRQGCKLINTYNTTQTPADQVHLWVYGAKQQPYITEIFAQTDTVDQAAVGTGSMLVGPNPHPYVAIELFFPYRVAPDPTGSAPGRWNMHGWSLALID